jgi:hypothetical protein
MTSNTISRRLPENIHFCAYAADPAIYIRNAWVEPVKPTATNPHRRYFGRSVKPLPVGDAIALVFGDEALVCNLRTTSTSQQTIYTRKLPTELALQDDTSLDSCTQWRCVGHASDYFAFDKADPSLPWRWNFRAQGDAMVIMPTAQPLGTALGLQISQPFHGESWLELHPYRGSWADNNTYLDRHPPVYPLHPDDAWGWLLPTAPFDFEIEGFRFRSVWEYAVNPILRARDASLKDIANRLVTAAQYRKEMDELWRNRIAANQMAIAQLAEFAPEELGLYWNILVFH